jgi:hypothetical protein
MPINHHYIVKFMVLAIIVWLGLKFLPNMKNWATEHNFKAFTPPSAGSSESSTSEERAAARATDYPFKSPNGKVKGKGVDPAESFYQELP